MRTAVAALSLVLLACATPPAVQAQCNDECIRLVSPDGTSSGYGCITGSSGMSCTATTTRCSLRECKETFLFSPFGQFAALINTCDLAQGPLSSSNGKLAQLTSSLAAFVPGPRSAARLAST